MPIYEYECTKCNQIEEALQKFSDKPLTKCRHCSGKLQKLISQSSFHLKGTGWYVTDYANRSGSPPPKKMESKPSTTTDDTSTATADTSKTDPVKSPKAADTTS